MEPAFFRSACPEKELLACCARVNLSPGVVARIRDLVAGPLDWDYAIAQARDHSVLPLLQRNLRLAASEIVPRAVLADLESQARANAIRCLAQSSELLRVVDSLGSRGIHVLPYKGPVVAAQAYENIAARQFDDLDIILAQHDIPAAHDVVCGLGYEPRFPWLHSSDARSVVPGEYNYRNAARQTLLELHTEATLRHFPVRAPLAEFFDRAVSVDLGGQNVRTFRAEDALPVCCIHGAKDFWSKLIWVADVAELVRSHGNMDWDAVLRVAERLRANRMLYLGLGLAAGMLDVERLPAIRARVKADRRATAMAAQIAGRLLGRDAPECSAQERFAFRRQTVEGGVAGWRYALRLTFAPSEEDWRQRNAPRAGALTSLLRPFRLFRKYR